MRRTVRIKLEPGREDAEDDEEPRRLSQLPRLKREKKEEWLLSQSQGGEDYDEDFPFSQPFPSTQPPPLESFSQQRGAIKQEAAQAMMDEDQDALWRLAAAAAGIKGEEREEGGEQDDEAQQQQQGEQDLPDGAQQGMIKLEKKKKARPRARKPRVHPWQTVVGAQGPRNYSETYRRRKMLRSVRIVADSLLQLKHLLMIRLATREYDAAAAIVESLMKAFRLDVETYLKVPTTTRGFSFLRFIFYVFIFKFREGICGVGT